LQHHVKGKKKSEKRGTTLRHKKEGECTIPFNQESKGDAFRGESTRELTKNPFGLWGGRG